MVQNLQSELYQEFDSEPSPVVDFMRWLVCEYDLPQPLDVLDIGCGPGRMLVEYARLGWRVTGTEPDADFYQAASETSADYPTIKVKRGGFENLNTVDAYDLITAVNDPLAYLLEVHERVDALARMYRALRPGGVMFLEVKNFLFKLLYHEPLSEEITELGDQKVAHIMQHEIDFHDARWIHRDEYIVEDEQQVISKTHELAIISPPELLYFIEQQGFVDVQTFNSYHARQSERFNSRLMLIAARKPY